ncbi:MAG TPA: hypothetical protein VJS15_06960, partial [Allosphingosinicella sp.]|nr:hypothetical protein [Allosphingosinicella sp.]
MALRFRPWEPTARFGKPHEAVEAFTARTAQIALRMPAPATDIWFEVVDIRPTAEDPSLVIEKVTKLFLEPRFIRASIAPNSRLLFAGAARSLAEWEPESELRSVNSDIELFIRALQSLDVGHYVCVDPDAGRTEDAIGHGWITSALFAFQRFYAKKENREADAADRLTQLSGDVIKLFVSARARKGFERLGIPGSYKGAGDPQDDTLLNEIRLLYQLGKRDRLSEHGAEREFERGRIEETVELDLPSASYDLLGSIESKVMPWAEKYKLVSKRLHPMGAIGDAKAAQWLAGATFKMKRYEMLRDLGRLIGSNAVAQLRQQIEKARKARRGGGPLFLIMDDFIYYYLIGLSPRAEEEEDETNLIIAAIKRVFEAVDCKAGDFLVIPTMAMPVEGDTLGGEAHLSIFRDTDMKPVTLDGKPAAAPQSPESYVAILMDPEAASDALGPVRVQRMANYLRQVPQRTAGRRGREGKGVRVPSIIAFSQRESSGHVQQCLNLGAAAFTAKHRPYHLLFDLNRVLREAAPGRPSTDRASQFRILRTLKPHTGVKLHRGEGPAFLHGGLYCPEERDRHRLDDFLDDPREETWLRSLPKADLHCHIGTCIDYATIELMALNSVGYMLGSGRLGTVPDGSLKAAAHGVGALLDTAARIVSLADALKPKEGDRPGTGSNAPPLIRLAAAAAVTVVDRDSPLQPQAFGLGDAIIARLRRIDERCALFQVAAVLVATISLHPRRDDGAAPYGAAGGPLDYLDALAKQASRPSAGKPRSRAAFSLGSALDHSLRRAMNRLEEIAHRWDGRFTEGQIRDAIGKGRPPKQLRGLIEALRARTDRAEQVLKASFKKARGLEEDNPEQFEQERNAALEWLKAQG